MRGRLVFVCSSALLVIACDAVDARADQARSLGAALAGPSASVEAESMTLDPPAAGAVFSDPAASGGEAQLVFANGSLVGPATLGAPANQIVVRALGDPCAGAPQMVVRVDGAAVGTVTVGAVTWTDYPVPVALGVGTHSVEVRYVNDFTTGNCDRNLRIDRVAFVTSPPATGTLVKLGAAVNHSHLFDANEPAYAATVEREFDSITAEYEMKMDQVLPTDATTYDFSAGDRLLAYASAHGKQLRGHTLLWYRALPSWMTGRTWTRDQLLAFMQTYVTAVVGHYRGQLPEWDVVNEAFNDDGTYRSSIWYDVIGPEYIEAAFRFARAADPTARLYYNDYGIESANPKSDAALALASRLRALGMLDGVGFQSHFSASWYPTEAQFGDTLARFAAAGVDIGVTELDVAMGDAHASPAQDLDQQAGIYGAIARACQAQPACKRFTVWGVTDRYTWLSGPDVPLLFDLQYAAKPAYSAVRAAFSR